MRTPSRNSIIPFIAQVMDNAHIVIIGGQAGGMSCATRLRRLNEKCRITVLEKSSHISSGTCGIPYALGRVIEDQAKLNVMSVQKAKSWFNIEVITNTEVISIDTCNGKVIFRKVDDDGNAVSDFRDSTSYDKLVIASGAEATKPPIPGLDHHNVFTLKNLHDLENAQQFLSKHEVHHVAVIGGGFIGLEAAENLVHRGYQVTLLEYLPQVMPIVDADIAEVLHSEVRRHGVNLTLNARIEGVYKQNDSIGSVIHLEKAEPINLEAIFVTTGIRPIIKVAQEAHLNVSKAGINVDNHLRTTNPNVYAVGDAIGTENIISHEVSILALGGPANRQGRMVADLICGREDQFRGHVGTAVCKVFDQVVGIVGPSVQTLEKIGKKFQYLTIHPSDHATYYPDSHQMVLRVAFDESTGKILGAQAVGKAGIDKRIDVLATAIQAGLTIHDLQHLELAYAPPYSSAKDPINMVGFVGSNILQRDVEIVHARDILKPIEGQQHDTKPPTAASRTLCDYQIVDVRSAEEFQDGHLCGSTNIPLSELRQRFAELDPEKPTLVYCWVGYRGYLAYRILHQLGFKDLVNLDGGLKLVAMGGFSNFILSTREQSEFGC